MTDPTAALVEELHNLELEPSGRVHVEGDHRRWHERDAAAILAALRPGWTLVPTGEIARLREAIAAVLSDEPVLDPTPKGVIWRWYSEGWNRCARDVRAALETDAP